MEKLIYFGLILIFIGFISIFIGSLFSSLNQEKTNMKAAGGIFIGPFPIFGFASDKKMFYLLMIIAIILYIFFRKS